MYYIKLKDTRGSNVIIAHWLVLKVGHLVSQKWPALMSTIEEQDN